MHKGQYVVFKLGDETYGIDIMKVREITEYKKTTKIPNAPGFVDGVVNLRGNIVPVINLKKRFCLDTDGVKGKSRIIVINMRERLIGFLVDDALRVITMGEEDIDNTPEIITEIDSSYIMGIGRIEEEIIILLDPAAILSEKEKKAI